MELIKISENNGQSVVSARDLYAFLEASERFTNWFERQLQYGFIENQDYVGCKVFNTLANQELQDYALSLDCAKEIAMIQKSEKGKQARLYFIECEKKLREVALHSYQIEDPIKRAEKWIEEQKEKQALALKASNLQIALDNDMEWCSIIKAAQFNKVKETVFDWRLLKARSIEMGLNPKKMPSKRYAFQNVYHVNVFRAVYPEFNYNFKD